MSLERRWGIGGEGWIEVKEFSLLSFSFPRQEKAIIEL
jgi:hypothetical protein